MATLALVAHSARAMAEAAAREGHRPLAIDLFGDADTQRASVEWCPAGEPGSSRLHPQTILTALRRFAARGDVAGWVAGGGCEGEPELLAEGARTLPLIGCAPAVVARLRDPLDFFGFLAAHGIAHPEVRGSTPADPEGWLVKDATGCGGWHIRRAADVEAPVTAPRYFQREAAGEPMSATFCANGSEMRLLGINRLLVRRFEWSGPYVFSGAIGPVALPPAAAQQVGRALRLLASGFGMQGLASLDFLLDGDALQVLEVNPRMPATMALYDGTFTAHLDACLHGHLPEPLPPAAMRRVRGFETVWAPRALQLGEAGAARLQGLPDCHDLPRPGSRFRRGDPLCTVSAEGAGAAEVERALAAARDAALRSLETA